MSRPHQDTQASELNTTTTFSTQDFIRWEKMSRDTIDVKRIYIDIAGSLTGGVLLSQIIYWHLPDDKGNPKLTVEQEGHLWFVKKQDDWWDECRITMEEYKLAIKVLVSKGLIIKRIFKFDGNPTSHLRVNWEKVIESISSEFSKNLFDKCETHQTTSVKHTKPHIYNKETTYKDMGASPPTPPNSELSKDNFKKQTSPPEVKSVVGDQVPKSVRSKPDELSKVTVCIPLEDWEELCHKFGENKVLEYAKKISDYMVDHPEYRKRNAALAIPKWIAKDLEDEKSHPKKKSPHANYEGAGSLPTFHKTVKM
jgi:hypothetical protein